MSDEMIIRKYSLASTSYHDQSVRLNLGGLLGYVRRIPRHHKVFTVPETQSSKSLDPSSHCPVPSCRELKMSFCFMKKLSVDNQSTIARRSSSKRRSALLVVTMVGFSVVLTLMIHLQSCNTIHDIQHIFANLGKICKSY
jgi:hypothetical protein